MRRMIETVMVKEKNTYRILVRKTSRKNDIDKQIMLK
jgi:hypothetical protein